MFESLKGKARAIKKEVRALSFALGDDRLPLFPKILIGFTLGYALSPVDLIPDFIPVLGYLDDLLLLPLFITLSVKSIPAEIMKDARAKAESDGSMLKKNRFAGAVIICLWLILLTALTQKILSKNHS